MEKCKQCVDLSELERDYSEEPHKGADFYCDECEAEYYEPFSVFGEVDIITTNEQAQFNHPELETYVKNPHAVALGSIKSEKKAISSRKNGLLGGRPKVEKVVDKQG